MNFENPIPDVLTDKENQLLYEIGMLSQRFYDLGIYPDFYRIHLFELQGLITRNAVHRLINDKVGS